MANRERAQALFVQWRSEVDNNPLDGRLLELIEQAIVEAEKRGEAKVNPDCSASHCIPEQVDEAIKKAKIEGQKEMRERAAKLTCDDLADAILALPIEGE